MRVKTSELTGAALNWAAALADGKKPRLQRNSDGSLFPQPVYDEYVWQLDYLAWNRGGPLIERERITLRVSTMEGTSWAAFYDVPGQYHAHIRHKGPSPLVAAMRCFVESKLGDTVEIPEELTCR